MNGATKKGAKKMTIEQIKNEIFSRSIKMNRLNGVDANLYNILGDEVDCLELVLRVHTEDGSDIDRLLSRVKTVHFQDRAGRLVSAAVI